MVFCLFAAKRLETWKSFITSDPEAFACNVLIPLTVPVSGFTHNPAFLAVSEFKMAGSAELVRLVDLAETEGARRKPTKAIEFSPQVTQFFFFYIIRFLVIFRSFYRIFRTETGDF